MIYQAHTQPVVIGSDIEFGRMPGGVAAWWLSGGVAAANCKAAYRAKGAASLAASYTNLANPGTYDAAPGVAPTWASATGWGFDGATQYLTTGVVPSSGWSYMIRYSGANGNGAVCGSLDAGQLGARFDLFPYAFGGSCFPYNGGTTPGFPGTAAGTVGMAGRDYYAAGIYVGTNDTWTGVNAYDAYIGCRNLTGAANSFLLCNVQAYAIWDIVLTAPQMAAIAAAMAAL